MPMRQSLVLRLVALALVLATAPTSADELRPGIIGNDDRIPLSVTGRPWDAIGQVNIRGYRTKGLCTGTLVAPDVVITAAHCVIDPWKGTPYPLKDIHFLAGVRGTARAGHAVAKCLHFAEVSDVDRRDGGPGKMLTGTSISADALQKDAVALILDQELSVEPALLADNFIVAAGITLMHAAYPADRRSQLTAHANCQLLRTAREGRLWFSDCDTHPASSGGPVFIVKDGLPQLAAIMVASGDRTANIALPISTWRPLLRDTRCPSSG